MSLPVSHLQKITETLQLATHVLKGLQYNKQDQWHLVVLVLYARIVELTEACRVLLKFERLIGIPILFRSIFEADANLVNVIRDKSYMNVLNANFLKEKLRHFEHQATNPENPFFGQTTKDEVEREIQNVKKELDDLKRKGFAPKSNAKQADDAGMKNEYQSVYAMLCLDSHNNIRSLEDHHLSRSDNGAYHLMINKTEQSDIEPFLDSIARVLFNKTCEIAKIFNVQFDMTPYLAMFDASSETRSDEAGIVKVGAGDGSET